MKKEAITLTLSLILLGSLILINFDLPKFGSFPNRKNLESIASYYLKNTLGDTSALNTVAAIVWIYRGYDTLGEVTILFTSIVGILLLLNEGKK